MTTEKECVNVYLDSELIYLLLDYADKNRLTLGCSVESILKQYLTGDDNIDMMNNCNHLNEHIDGLEKKMGELARVLQSQVETIDRLDRQVAELECDLEDAERTEFLEETRVMVKQNQARISEIDERLMFLEG